jgi:2-polyprenyl-6-hydroxyphenyl methylase/3-demethylubiquinone-9 3-methyltransferase
MRARLDRRLWLGERVAIANHRPRNDPRQYDDLVHAWWDAGGVFAMLHWLAAARAAAVPPARRDGAVLVDVGCGGGLLAPHVAGRGYRHVGVDLTESALRVAARHHVTPLRADAACVPLADASADVVCAGEILEHVTDTGAVAAEACRVLRPGGTLVIDTIADTRLADLIAVRIAERLPGAAPPGIHDPALFVDRRALVATCAARGVTLQLRGLRPALGDLIRWRVGRRAAVRMVPTASTAVLFQGLGTKAW